MILDLAGQQGALDLPVFVAISADEVTVDADAARRWFCTSLGRASGYRHCLHYDGEKDAPSWFFCADPAADRVSFLDGAR